MLKEGTSVKLSKSTLEKLKRVSSIMEMTVSDFVEESLNFYFEKSDVGKKCMKRILQNQRYVESMERGKRSNQSHIGSGTIIGEIQLKGE